jgi:hypothetical protein
MSLFYYLNTDHTYHPCDVHEWREQFEKMDRHVADDVINDLRVSTVWLGNDHNILGDRPLLLETMVFEGKGYMEIYCDRYSTWDEAVIGHKKAIQWVKDGCKDEPR